MAYSCTAECSKVFSAHPKRCLLSAAFLRCSRNILNSISASCKSKSISISSAEISCAVAGSGLRGGGTTCGVAA